MKNSIEKSIKNSIKNSAKKESASNLYEKYQAEERDNESKQKPENRAHQVYSQQQSREL